MKYEIVLSEVFKIFWRSLLKFVTTTFSRVRMFLQEYILQELNYCDVLYTNITFFLIKVKLQLAGQKISAI